jgi:DNA primase
MNLKTKQWLLNRGISEKILADFNIHENPADGSIVIPVKFKDKIIFNKYRRSPFKEDGPKYWYDNGGSVQLFNGDILANSSEETDRLLMLGEGEMDTLRILSLGIDAVTSTGGAMSFQEDWARLFRYRKNIIVVFDNDIPGIKGMIKVMQIIPHARMVLLPVGKGKDITEYLQKNTIKDFFALPTFNFHMPHDLEIPYTNLDIKNKMKELRDASENLIELQRVENGLFHDTRHIDYILIGILDKYENYKRLLSNENKEIPNNIKGDIERAKQYPVERLLKFNHQGFTKCIWHEDKTPSLHYWPEKNAVKCFACNKFGDPIDIVKEMEGLNFLEAVKFINKKHV